MVKRAGYRAEIRPASWSFSVRLYQSCSEIINGYTKNLYEGMDRNPVVGIAAVLFILIGAIIPVVGLLVGVVGIGGGLFSIPPWILIWLLVICLFQVLFRYRIERYDDRSGAQAWFHPLANLLLVWILLRSTFGVRVQWKGRTFIDGKAN